MIGVFRQSEAVVGYRGGGVYVGVFGQATYGMRFEHIMVVRPDRDLSDHDRAWLDQLRCRLEPGGSFEVVGR